jgi:hypothetical protein
MWVWGLRLTSSGSVGRATPGASPPLIRKTPGAAILARHTSSRRAMGGWRPAEASHGASPVMGSSPLEVFSPEGVDMSTGWVCGNLLEAKIWIGPDGGFTTPVNGDSTGSGGETAQQLGRTRAREWAGRTGSAGRSECGCRLTCFFCISGVLGNDDVETSIPASGTRAGAVGRTDVGHHTHPGRPCQQKCRLRRAVAPRQRHWGKVAEALVGVAGRRDPPSAKKCVKS